MKNSRLSALLLPVTLLMLSGNLFSQNPFVKDQFTADPSARVFNGRVYVFPSHDILANEERGRIGWFCMEDYHVFSSSDMVHWTDHGMIVSQENVEWADPKSYSMWAPDCIEKDGKYYFYFPAVPQSNGERRGFSVGVAIADQPEGPYTPEKTAIKGLMGIDPNPFIDKDGQAYLYWSMGKIFVAKLKENMLELASEPQVVSDMPEKGLIEGPFLFERKGKYYMTYPHVENQTERLEYAIGDNPMGPFTYAGVIMDESPVGCWTNHQSIIQYKDQWFLFYHHNDYSPHFDKNRSIRIDSLFFNEDGTIQKVKPSLRGVGISDAREKVELDRYSSMSEEGVTVAFVDTLNTFEGWKTILEKDGAWIQYNTVDFGDEELDHLNLRVKSENGAILHVFMDRVGGPLIEKVKVPPGSDWLSIEKKIFFPYQGIHNLVIQLEGSDPIEIDWIRFD